MRPDYEALHPFSPWGPYSKVYKGFSHVPHVERQPMPAPLDAYAAVRFDITTVPALHSTFQSMPNTTAPGSSHPWHVSKDLQTAVYRYELGYGPSEKAYAEVSYCLLENQTVLVSTRFFNNTDKPLDAVVNYFMSLQYPYESIARIECPKQVRMIPGAERHEVSFARHRPWDAQQPDATPKAVFRDPDFTGGFGFGDRVSCGHVPDLLLQPWGVEAGDHVSFQAESLFEETQDAMIGIRYRTIPLRDTSGLSEVAREAMGLPKHAVAPPTSVSLVLSGAIQGCLTLPPHPHLKTLYVPVDGETLRYTGEPLLTLTALGADSGLELDCLFFGPEKAVQAVTFHQQPLMPCASQIDCQKDGYLIRYPSASLSYRFIPLNAVTRSRTLPSGTLEDAEPARITNPHFTFDDLSAPFSASFRRKHSSPGEWFNVIERSVLVPPKGSVERFALLSYEPDVQPAAPSPQATDETVALQHINGRLTGLISGEEQRVYSALAQAGRSQDLTLAPPLIREGISLLSATLLQNIVYPIYTKWGWIFHFTPGKRWDNLYTWDGGFIALGLIPLNRRLAEYMLDLYLAPPDDPEQAFVHHGSPVPVQFMVLREMVATAQGEERERLLRRYYLRTRLFYEFLLGRTHGSTTDRFKTGLLSTYEYFYSASGMDDYPAQLLSHVRNLARVVSPVITTSQALLGGMTLELLATEFLQIATPKQAAQLEQDMALYAADRARLSNSLEQHAWDEESGYYGYVVHDTQGEKLDLLRDEAGNNLNCGFDGIYPLVAGGGQAKHQAILVSHIKNERELLTPYGLTAVAQNAPYYSSEGYWNGAVWFPHAWYFGRALLDCAEGDFLLSLVERQLSAWCAEACERWNSYEMLRVVSGRGAWHFEFGGLSAPLVCWAHSLYTPGTVTTGFSALLLKQETTADSLHITLRHRGKAPSFQVWIRLGNDLPASPILSVACIKREKGFCDYDLSFGTTQAAPLQIPATLQEIKPGLFQVTLYTGS